MSKIGRVNLELQDQANELGFSTVQEALDNGYEVDYFWNSPDAEDFGTHPELVYLGKDDEPLEEAHKAWLKEKEEVIKGLQYVAVQTTGAKEEYVRKAIEFIERGEI